MNRSQDIKCFVLQGGGILLVAPDGRTECAYSPQLCDGASADALAEHFAYVIRNLDAAVRRLQEPSIDLARESSSAPVGTGGE